MIKKPFKKLFGLTSSPAALTRFHAASDRLTQTLEDSQRNAMERQTRFEERQARYAQLNYVARDAIVLWSKLAQTGTRDITKAVKELTSGQLLPFGELAALSNARIYSFFIKYNTARTKWGRKRIARKIVDCLISTRLKGASNE